MSWVYKKMENKNPKNNFDKLKTQIELLKQRLSNMDKILNIQEDILDVTCKNTESLFKDALIPKKVSEVNDIMKNVFSKGTIPKILFK